MKRVMLVGVCALMWASSSLAVPYTLPSGPEVKLAQLQTLSDYFTVCKTGSPCDVPAGDYQLVVFDALWNPSISIVTVGGAMSNMVTIVTETCPMDLDFAPEVPVICTATCPAATVATGGACAVTLPLDDAPSGVGPAAFAQASSYQCRSSLLALPNEGVLPIDQGPPLMTASVYCLSD